MPTFKLKRKLTLPKQTKRIFFSRASRLPKITSQVKTIKTITKPVEETPTAPAPDIIPEPETNISEISRFIRDTAAALKEGAENQPETSKPIIIDEPSAFDGMGTTDERLKMMEAQVLAEAQKAKKLEHQLMLLEAEFSNERKELQNTIRELKQELHRTVPLHDNKFFSLSKDLREAMEDIQKIGVPVNSGTIPDTAIPMEQPAETVIKPKVVSAISNQNNQDEVKEAVNPKEKKSSSVKRKLLTTAGVAVAIVLGISGILSLTLFKTPKVDEAIVEEYLKKQGVVAGTADSMQVSPTAKPAATDNTPLPDANINADTPLEQTEWETFSDPIMGVQLTYPKNGATINKTDSSVTFLKNTGYLVKIQRIETKLGVTDYWEQTKATSTGNFIAEPTTFREKKALHLTSTEATSYPGNKYLIEANGVIYDVWYATKSNEFTENDIKKVTRMIETLLLIK